MQTVFTKPKATKIIDLVEVLRRDLPNVKNRHDNEAAVLKQSMNPDLVLAGLDEPDESEILPKAIVAAAKIRSGKNKLYSMHKTKLFGSNEHALKHYTANE